MAPWLLPFSFSLLRLLPLLAAPQVEVHEVARLLRPAPESPASRYGSHILTSEDEEERTSAYLPSSSRLGFLSADCLQQLLRRAVGEEGFAVDPLGEAWLVRGSSSAQSKARDLLSALRAAAARRVEVELSFHDLAGGKGGASGEPGKALASARLDLVPGALGSYGRRTERSFLMDYDVEVAERASVADPEFGTILAGLGIDLRAHLLSDGRVHLTLLADRGEALGSEPFDTGAEGLGTLDVPRVGVAAIASCASVREGEAARFEVRDLREGEGPGFLLSVRARSIPREEPLADGSRLLPVGFLADAGGRLLPRFDDRLRAVADEEAPDPETVPPSRFLEWLREALGAERFDSVLGGGALAVPGSDSRVALAGVPEEVLARAGEIRGALEGPLASGVSLLLEIGGGGEAPSPSPSARLGVTVGRACGAVLGVESTRVADYDVEIAQRSVAADPVVVREFDGVVFRAGLLALEGDRATLEVELLARSLGPRTRRATGIRHLGEVETAPVERAEVRRILTLAPGERALLGEVPAPGAAGSRLPAYLSAVPLR
ncbi:MAG: hypothetical protein ACREIU_13995 [Planctomycetota bacterium]